MSLEPLVTGWTGPLELVCQADGTRVVFTASQHTPTGILTSRAYGAKNLSGNVAWYTSCGLTYASCGAVAVTFDSTDLAATESPYLFRIRIAAGAASSEVVFFPNGPAESLEVYQP